MPGNPGIHGSENDVRCWRFRVSGKVQGVYFRASTRQEALRLGLTGLARNEADGTVTVFACGKSDALAALQDWLRHGPATARVTGLDVEPDVQQSFIGFSIA